MKGYGTILAAIIFAIAFVHSTDARTQPAQAKPAKKKPAKKRPKRKPIVANKPESLPIHRPPRTKTPLEALTEEFSFVDFGAMEKAVRHLARVYPEKYAQSDTYLQQIARYRGMRASLRQQLKSGNPQAMTTCREILAFRREILINRNPAINFDEVIYVKRKDWLHPKDHNIPHGGKSVGLPTNFEGNSMMACKGMSSEMGTIRIRKPSAAPRVIYKPADGSFVGDVDLHFGAKKMLFSSVDKDSVWQVFEIGVDGSGLRQISTSRYPDIDNYNPIYLPDGRIIFCSTSGYQSVPCVHGKSPVGNLHIMNADGSGVRRLTFDQDNDWYPVMRPNGQVMYTRWEYTDSPHFFTRMVMTMNPDGTGQRAEYGSNSFWPNSTFYPKPLPGRPSRFIGVVSGHHGTRRAGELYIFDTAKGRKETTGVVQRIPSTVKGSCGVVGDRIVDNIWPKFVQPQPITDKCFLVACKPGPDSHWGLY